MRYILLILLPLFMVHTAFGTAHFGLGTCQTVQNHINGTATEVDPRYKELTQDNSIQQGDASITCKVRKKFVQERVRFDDDGNGGLKEVSMIEEKTDYPTTPVPMICGAKNVFDTALKKAKESSADEGVGMVELGATLAFLSSLDGRQYFQAKVDDIEIKFSFKDHTYRGQWVKDQEESGELDVPKCFYEYSPVHMKHLKSGVTSMFFSGFYYDNTAMKLGKDQTCMDPWMEDKHVGRDFGHISIAVPEKDKINDSPVAGDINLFNSRYEYVVIWQAINNILIS